MMGRVFGHNFVNFKSTEMICWPCGWVTPRFDSNEKLEAWLRSEGGCHCPKVWHGKGKKIDETPS